MTTERRSVDSEGLTAARYNERYGLPPRACNCHHGSARMCPIHSQADYDAQGLRAALEAVEFVHGICPACSGTQPDHEPDCLTAAALAAQPAAGEGLEAIELLPRIRLTGEKLDELSVPFELFIDWDEYDEFVRLDDVRAALQPASEDPG